MKKLLTLAILIAVPLIMGTIDFVPWWSFLVLVFLCGIILPLQKWKVSPFIWGFIAGFMVWVVSTIYFEITYKGEVMQAVAKIIKVGPYALHFGIGVIGGLLTGLALYAGYLLRKGREVLVLELPGN